MQVIFVTRNREPFPFVFMTLIINNNCIQKDVLPLMIVYG
jgi:hypothetical protein